MSLSSESGFDLALLGKASGATGSTITFRDVNDTTNRIVATTDSSGDRLTVTLVP